MTDTELSADSVRAAAERIGSGIRRTPTVRSRALSALVRGDVFLKVENRQTTGSYKERGALNAMLLLTRAERERGVITMSAGNHGQAVAYHGARLGIRTTVVMPETTPFLKVRRTRGFGADVVLHGATFDDAAAFARASAERTGATIVHPTTIRASSRVKPRLRSSCSRTPAPSSTCCSYRSAAAA